MPSQDDSPEIKEARRQMRAGRKPLIDAAGAAYQNYLIAFKGWQRKNSELRESVGLLNVEFGNKSKMLRESARNAQEGGAGAVETYKELSAQAKAVVELIDKELPNLEKLYKPVGDKYAAFVGARDAYANYMAQWKGQLPDGDLADRAYELAIQAVEKALR